MACRISELVLGCRDPELLARFWCEVLDFIVLYREDDGSVEIGPREDSAVRSRRSSSAAGISRSRESPDCTSTSTPPTAIRGPSSKGFSRSVPARQTSARQAMSSGTSWPTLRATNSAYSRPAFANSDTGLTAARGSNLSRRQASVSLVLWSA